MWCGHELLETLQTGTWRGLQRAQLLLSTWFQREFRAPEKSSRTPRHIFSHLKYSRLMLHRGRFSVEVEQVGIPPISTKSSAWLPCSWLSGHPRCLRDQMGREKGTYLQLLEGKSKTVKRRHYRRWRGKSCQEQRFSFCIQSDFLLSITEVTGFFLVPVFMLGCESSCFPHNVPTRIFFVLGMLGLEKLHLVPWTRPKREGALHGG